MSFHGVIGRFVCADQLPNWTVCATPVDSLKSMYAISDAPRWLVNRGYPGCALTVAPLALQKRDGV